MKSENPQPVKPKRLPRASRKGSTKQDKSDISEKVLKQLEESFSVLTTIMQNFAKESKSANKDTLSKLKEQEKLLKSIDKGVQSNEVKIHKDSAAIFQSIDKNVKLVAESNQLMKDQQLKADFAEEQKAEELKEERLVQQERAEKQEDLLGKIVTKLETLDNSISNISVGNGSSGLLSGLGSLVSGILPLVITGLTNLVTGAVGLITPLLAALFPAVIAAITVGAAALAGYKLFEKFIEPNIDEMTDRLLQKTGVSTGYTKEEVLTDTGEKVFTKTNPETGEQTLVTETEMKQELEKLPEEQKKTAIDQYQQKFNIKKETLPNMPGQIVSGSPIEKMREQFAEKPSEYDILLNEIFEFDKNFRKTIIDFKDEFKYLQNDPINSGYPNDFILLGNQAAYLEVLAEKQNTLIDRIKTNSKLTEEEKINLFKSSPLFKDAENNKASAASVDYGGAAGRPVSFILDKLGISDVEWKDADYTLPSGITLDIKDLQDIQIPISEYFKEIGIPDIGTPPEAASGAVVFPKTGKGVLTNISEDMKPEAVVPLDEYVIQSKSDIQPVDVSDKAVNMMRQSYFEEKDASSMESQRPIVVNNVRSSGGDGGTAPINYQFQTSLAKTFDNVFEEILRKNLTLSVVT